MGKKPRKPTTSASHSNVQEAVSIAALTAARDASLGCLWATLDCSIGFIGHANAYRRGKVRGPARKTIRKLDLTIESEEEFWKATEAIRKRIEEKRDAHNRVFTKPVYDQISVAAPPRSNLSEVCGRKVATAHEAGYWAITSLLTILVTRRPPVTTTTHEYVDDALERMRAQRIEYETIDAEIQVEFAAAVRRVEELQGRSAAARTRHRPPLNDRARAVRQLLGQLPEDRGLSGKEIMDKLAITKYPIHIKQSELTRRIIPALKPYGVVNQRGVGYCIRDAAARPA